MAVFRVRMSECYEFNIRADDEMDVEDWTNSHSVEDLKNESTYYDISYRDEIIGTESDDEDFVAINISKEE